MTREEAIHFATCLKNNWTINFADMEDFCDMAIEALDTYQNCVKCGHYYETEDDSGVKSHCKAHGGSDLISRQAAIEAVEKAVFKGVAKSAIESLPPVEPPKKVVAQIKVDIDELVERIKEEYEITDKVGEWIEHDPKTKGLAKIYECPFCGDEVIGEKTNFCPNCRDERWYR